MKRASLPIRRFLAATLLLLSLIQFSAFHGANQASANMPSGSLLVNLRANGISTFPGRQNVRATFTPADNTFSAATSPTSTIQAVKRGGTR